MSLRAKAHVLRLSNVAAGALLLLSWATFAPQAMADGLFSGLAGSWRGDGSITWSTGETERLRCNATYTVEREGNKLVQNLTCATDSTKLIVKSAITYNPAAGALSGTWMESSYGLNGFVSGRANATAIRAIVQSLDKSFSALVTVVTKGSDQTVTIAPEGLDVTEVSVKLRRAS